MKRAIMEPQDVRALVARMHAQATTSDSLEEWLVQQYAVLRVALALTTSFVVGDPDNAHRVGRTTIRNAEQMLADMSVEEAESILATP